MGAEPSGGLLDRARALALRAAEARARFDAGAAPGGTDSASGGTGGAGGPGGTGGADGAGGADAAGWPARVAALAEAVDATRQALALPFPEPGPRAVLNGWLSSHLYHRWHVTGDPADLHEAVALGRAALAGPHPEPAEAHRNQCAALLALFGTTGDLAFLDEAAVHGRGAVDRTPPGHPARAGCLSNLAAVLHRVHQFRRAPDAADALDAAVAAEREALALTAPDDPAHARYGHNLATHLRARYDTVGDPDALQEACELARAAAHALGDPLHLMSAAGVLLTRYLARGDLADAREALDLADRALARVPPGDPRRGAFLNIASAAMGRLVERTGDPELARRATVTGAEAVAATPAPHTDRPGHLRNLAAHRVALFRLTGDTAELRSAVRAVEEALALLPPTHPERGGCHSVLVETLATLYAHIQEPGLLDDAVRAARSALREGPREGAQRVPWLNNLSAVLHARYGLDHDPARLAESVATAREAVRLAGADPRLPLYLGTLGAALRDLGSVHGNDPVLRAELVAVARRALEHTPAGSPDQPRRTGELAWSLVLSAAAGNDGAAAEAVTVARRALRAMPSGGAGHAGAALTLGSALRVRHRPPAPQRLPAPPDGVTGAAELLSDQGDFLTEAADVLASGAADEASLPHDRLECARSLSGLWLSAGEPARALAAVESAVDLLPYVAPRHLDRSGRERGIERHAGLPQQAVAVALAAGRPDRAVELLERTRGVLLGEVIAERGELTGREEHGGRGEPARHRGEHGGLREHGEHGGGPEGLPPALAAEFVRLRERLAVPAHWSHAPPGDRLGALAETERRRELTLRRDELLARIRAAPGRADFLRPPDLAELTASAAGAGPVVLVVEGPEGGHALVVGADPAAASPDGGVRVIPLPELTPGGAHRWAARLREAPARTGRLDRDDLLAVLAWLWDAVAGPVLTALDPAPGSRLWWCPTGALALLPLHAAGRYGAGPAVSVLDRVVSSYTPTLRALAYARARAADGNPQGDGPPVGGPLVVSVAEAAGQPVLTGADREAAEVGRRLAGARLLRGAAADRATVLAALPRHAVAHFACHGVDGVVSPTGNGVLLADADGRPLTVAAVAALDLRGAALAYLSACGTGETRLSLADESVHLASGFQLAGYPHVVGSLWPVPDLASERMAAAFYAHAAEDGRLAPERVPYAFDRAVREVRDRYPRHPELWTAFVHHGA
ncbi:CHAT domain-containing protein [Streptomyces sp. NPDC086091]|uniref:CHAT domain-containing protein n=1 Tax=Streptomyces sp. NPDC086091 TaxID=3365751 RepID=UPI0037FFCBAB